jgi:hypothetical protein
VWDWWIGWWVSWWERWLRWLICFIRRLFARSEVSFQASECIYGWQAAYAIAETACTLQVTVRIRLNPDADVTAAELAGLQATWEQGIEQRWSNRFEIIRSSGDCACSRYAVTFDVQFVTSNEHHTVRVRRGPARSNMTTWDTADDAGAASHEFGHMLGLPDEYADPSCPDRVVATDNSIMRTNGGDPMNRHYQPLAVWISNRTCCNYSVGS